MELRDYGKLFLRRKWPIAFTILFVMLFACVYCVVTPELYKSTITIPVSYTHLTLPTTERV